VTEETIRRSFEATGVWPLDAEVILQHFNTTTLEQDEDTELCKLGDRDSWSDQQFFLDAAVTDKAKAEGKCVAAALHSLQVRNKLLHHKNNGFCTVFTTKQKHKKKSKVLNLQQHKKYHGSTVLWSPCKI
jgi:hypothetical protein